MPVARLHEDVFSTVFLARSVDVALGDNVPLAVVSGERAKCVARSANESQGARAHVGRDQYPRAVVAGGDQLDLVLLIVHPGLIIRVGPEGQVPKGAAFRVRVDDRVRAGLGLDRPNRFGRSEVDVEVVSSGRLAGPARGQVPLPAAPGTDGSQPKFWRTSEARGVSERVGACERTSVETIPTAVVRASQTVG